MGRHSKTIKKRREPTISSKKIGKGVVCKKLGSYNAQNKNANTHRKLEAINQIEQEQLNK